MDKNRAKRKRWMRRKRGIRKRVFGTPERPRMTVFRSNTHIYAQIIDDVRGRTIVAASSVKLERGADTEAAARVGTQLAERARASGIERVAFDRNGYRYHGRVKALADAARGQGLSF